MMLQLKVTRPTCSIALLLISGQKRKTAPKTYKFLTKKKFVSNWCEDKIYDRIDLDQTRNFGMIEFNQFRDCSVHICLLTRSIVLCLIGKDIT